MIHLSTIKKTILALLLPVMATAQVQQTVTTNTGYADQTFYSMANATVSTVSNTDWDLAFQISGFEAAILINSKNNVKLYNANKNVSEWLSMTVADTAGMTNNELLNNEAHMFNGAFNTTADTSNQFDLGWGIYDLGTHIIMGDSIYFIKLSNNTYKKLCIESLSNSTYNFRYADLDGSNEVLRSFNKLNYPGKNFGYYSIQNDQYLDREPLKQDWDLSFAQYVDHFINYKVTGVLTNDSVQAVKAYPVDAATATDAGLTYSFDNNIIGYDWKSFNGTTYVVADSTVYFVIDRHAHKWKIVFTGFGGSANGNFYFDQYDLGPLSVNDVKTVDVVSLYPNPATDNTSLVLTTTKNQQAEINIYDISGKSVYKHNYQLAGMQRIDIPTAGFAAGIYVVNIQTAGEQTQLKLVKN